MAKIENDSRQANYLVGNTIYLMDHFWTETMAELIGRVGALVSELPTNKLEKLPDIVNPYELSDSRPIIDIFINSGGGDVGVLTSLMTQLARARAKGARIRTTVMHNASSAASLLAVQGDKGLRVMYESSYHFIHYGEQRRSVTDVKAQEVAYNIQKQRTAYLQSIYTKNSDLPQEEVDQMYTTETGYLDAQTCLNRGLCDWILMSDGKIKGR